MEKIISPPAIGFDPNLELVGSSPQLVKINFLLLLKIESEHFKDYKAQDCLRRINGFERVTFFGNVI